MCSGRDCCGALRNTDHTNGGNYKWRDFANTRLSVIFSSVIRAQQINQYALDLNKLPPEELFAEDFLCKSHIYQRNDLCFLELNAFHADGRFPLLLALGQEHCWSGV